MQNFIAQIYLLSIIDLIVYLGDATMPILTMHLTGRSRRDLLQPQIDHATDRLPNSVPLLYTCHSVKYVHETFFDDTMTDEVYTSRVIEHLVNLEEVAEDILTDKQQLIDLDRRRQKTREAIRALNRNKKTKKTWVCFGNMFLKLEKEQTKAMLDKDFNQLDEEISETRKNLKPKVNKLRDLELKEEIKGFDLNPLTKEELETIENFM